MNEYRKVEGLEMVRDMSNMALINNNSSELQGYMNRRKFLKEQKNEINTIRQEVSDLKNDISQIKELLIQLNNR